MSTFYINPAYKSSIFNTSIDVQASSIPNRQSRENVSKSQERANWKPSHQEVCSFPQDAYFRQKRCDTRDKSLDDSKCNSSMDQSFQSFAKATQDVKVGKTLTDENRKQTSIRSASKEDRQVAILRMQEGGSNKQPLGERKDFNQKELEIAINMRNKFVQQQNSYKKELEKQIRDNHKNKKINELVDLSYSKSGLPIGEIHGGLDVEHQIKMMRIRANQLTRSESQGCLGSVRDRSFDRSLDRSMDRSLDRSRDDSCQIQNYNSNSFRGSSMSFYHERKNLAKSFIERVEEESDTHSHPTSPKSFAQAAAGKPSGVLNSQNNNKKKDTVESLLDPLSSKYMLKKQCHEKLRETLKAQLKKYEDYTLKLLEDRKKRRQTLMDDVEYQMTKEQHKKKAVVFRDKELGKKHKEMDIGEIKVQESVLQAKEAELARLAARCKTKENNKAKAKPARTQYERDGVYMRVVNDTINQLLDKRAKILEQAKRSSRSVERKAPMRF